MKGQPLKFFQSSQHSPNITKSEFKSNLTKSNLTVKTKLSAHQKVPTHEISKKHLSLQKNAIPVRLPNIASASKLTNIQSSLSNQNSANSKNSNPSFFNNSPIDLFKSQLNQQKQSTTNQAQIDEEYSPIPKSKFKKNVLEQPNNIIKLQIISSNEPLPIKNEANKIKISEVFFKSKAGLGPNRILKTNQDSYIIHQFNANRQYFGVCDGHGLHGQLVSQNIKKKLVDILTTQFKQSEDFEKILTQAYMQSNRDLKTSSIDCSFSGTTCVTVLYDQGKLYCANAGDSRAVLYSCKNNIWLSYPLSNDHKPDCEKEKIRILNNGGRVNCFLDEEGTPLGPYRVWLKDQDIPGLAMARSIGDFVAQSVGVIPEPEIIIKELSELDRFMIIASDGLWEFIDNDQVLGLILPLIKKKDWNGCVEKLVKEAHQSWLREDEVVDDITVVLVVFE